MSAADQSSEARWVERFQRGSTWLAVGEATTAVGAITATALFARTLTQTEFGMFALTLSIVNLVAGVINAQPWQLVTAEAAQAPGDRSVDHNGLIAFSWRLDIATSIVGFSLSAVVCAVAQVVTGRPFLALGAVYSLAVLLNFVTVGQALLRLDGRYRTLARVGIMSGIARLASGVFVLQWRPSLLVAVALWTAAESVTYLQLAVLGFRNYRPSPVATPIPADIRRRWFRFVIVTNLHSSVKLTVGQADMLLVGALSGVPAAAAYRIVKQVAAAILRAVAPIAQSVFPEIALATAAGDETRHLRRRAGLLAAIPAIATIGALALFGETLFGLVFGGYGSAVHPTMIYLIGVAIAGATVSWHPEMLARGHETTSFRVVLVSSAVYMAVLPLALRRWDVVGACGAFVLFYVVWASLMTQARRHAKWSQQHG